VLATIKSKREIDKKIIMKNLNIMIVLAFFMSFVVYSQTDYSNGWKKGYKAGYCYQDYGCTSPIPPVSPVPMAGKNTYQDGYNRGFTIGKSDKTKQSSTNSGGAYGQLKPLENTNTGLIVQEHIRRNKRKSNKNKSKELKISSNDLTLDKILSFKKKNIVFVEEYLTINNWEFQSGDESQISFIKGKRDETMMISVIYNNTKNVTSLVIIFYSKEKYKSYLESIKSLKCKLTSSNVEENEISKIYKNKKNEFHITVSKKDPKTNASLFVIQCL